MEFYKAWSLLEALEETGYILRTDGKVFKGIKDTDFGYVHPTFDFYGDKYEQNIQLRKLLAYFTKIFKNKDIIDYIEREQKNNNWDREKLIRIVDEEYKKEFCEVRLGGSRFYENKQGELYIRYWPGNYNWYDTIWNFIIKNKDAINRITIEKYDSANSMHTQVIKINNKYIDHISIDEFLTQSGNPIIK